MRRSGVLCVCLLAALVVPAGGTAGSVSGLRGEVTLYPARPVCVEDDPCTRPARGALLVFKREGRAVARVTTTREATYRVLLAPGAYTVVAPQYRIGSGVTPRVVRVLRGRVARMDLQIDTGIQ